MASTTTPAISKGDLRRRIEQTHRALRSALEALPRERFTDALSTGWSLNDDIAHLAAWEETVPSRVAAVLAGGEDPKLYDDVDGFNARVAADARGRTTDELFARWSAAHDALVGVLDSLTDEAPGLAFEIVQWNTTGHYPDHYADIGAAIRDANDLGAVVETSWIPFRLGIGALGIPALDQRSATGWTYKDLVAHAAAWEDRTAERLRIFRESGDAKRHPGVDDTDAFNAAVVERTRGRDGREVIRELDAAHERIVAEIQRLTAAQIHDHDDWVVAVVAGNTYGHYAEHFDELFAAVPKRPAELVERMREGWRPFRRAVGRLGLVPLSGTTPAGWSYKGMLSHVANWMERLPDELPDRLAGRRGPPPDVNKENQREATASEARSAEEVVHRLDAAYRAVVDLVTALPPDEDIPFLATRLVVGETYAHFVEHAAEIERAIPTTADGMVSRFDESWRRFRGAIRERGRAGLTERTPAGWSYRDLAAHAAAWLQQCVRDLETGDYPTWNKNAVQAFNDRAVEAHRLVGPEAMLDELDTSQRRAREAIAALSAERLADAKVWGTAAYYTYLHWEEHFEELGIRV